MRFFISILLSSISLYTQAAVSLDRTRVIYPGDTKSVSLTIRNNSNTLPYLAQAWIEDEKGDKVSIPFAILPPLQRLEPEMESLLKIQALPSIELLPQDKESLFYFNMREIPPRSNTPNTLQLALQTRIKFFYRPTSLLPLDSDHKVSWQERLEVSKRIGVTLLNNSTPYYISIIDVEIDGKVVHDFEPVMLAPHSNVVLPFNSGLYPSFTYLDDYGGRRKLVYHCDSSSCKRLKSI